MNNKGNISLYIIFLILGIIIITIGSIVGPMGVLFSTEMITAGETILGNANSSLQEIQDPTIKASVQDVVDSATNSAQTNIEVSGGLYQYSWLLLLVVTLIVLFITTRRLVEFGQGGLV